MTSVAEEKGDSAGGGSDRGSRIAHEHPTRMRRIYYNPLTQASTRFDFSRAISE